MRKDQLIKEVEQVKLKEKNKLALEGKAREFEVAGRICEGATVY